MPIDDHRRTPRRVADDTCGSTPARAVTIAAADIPDAMRRLKDHEARMKAIEAEEDAETCGAPPLMDFDEHGGEQNLSPERIAEIEAAYMKEVRQDLEDYRAGRLQGIPWEDLEAELFGPPTPEELAEAQSRRARR